MSIWPKVPLNEIARIGAGNSAPQDKNLFENGLFPFIRTGDVGAIKFGEIQTSNDLLNEAGTQGLREWPSGTILMPKSGASTFLNHRVIMTAPCFVASHLATIVPDEKKVIGRYLLYYLHTVRAQNIIQDQNYPSLRLPEIGAISVPLPPIEEQKRIVAILDEAFEGIAKATSNAERNLANARNLFESRLRVLIEEVSADAELQTLAEISDQFGRGKSKHRPRNDPALYGGIYPFIQTGDVRSAGHFITAYTQTYNEIGLKQSKLWPIGTICITIAANIAETGILTFDACFPDSIIGVVPNAKLAEVDYVEYLLQYFKVQLQAKGKGSAQDNINLGTFENSRFPFPIIEKQRRIVSRLNALDSECMKLQKYYSKKLTTLRELQQSILHKAFSGKLGSTNKQKSAVAVASIKDTVTPEYTADILAFAYAKHRTAQRDRTFGRVKGQKVLHLVEAIAHIDLGREPIKDAAGPNDSAHMRRAEDWAIQNGYFAFEARETGGYDFKPGQNFEKILASAYARLSSNKDAISKVINLLVPMDTQEAEVLATVHAAWSNLIIDGVEPTQDAIIAEARDNWTASKLEIPVAKFEHAIHIIRQNDIIPDGTAKPVGKKQESLF